jgi:hypothetical protein
MDIIRFMMIIIEQQWNVEKKIDSN